MPPWLTRWFIWYSVFNILKNCFPKQCTSLHPQQQCIKCQLLHILANTVMAFLLIAILVVWNGISSWFWLINIVEHLFICFLPISISSLEKCLDSFVPLTLHFPLLPPFHSPGPNPESFIVSVKSLIPCLDLLTWPSKDKSF